MTVSVQHGKLLTDLKVCDWQNGELICCTGLMRKKSSLTKARPRRQDDLALHRHWLAEAENIAHAPISKGGSPHPSVKVGAVLVDGKGRKIAEASNRFAQGLDRRRPERYKSGSKSLWINCAEQLAMIEALKKGASVKNATLYVTLEPCAVCAGLAAELQLKKVCVPVGSLRRYAKLKAKWKASIEIGLIKLSEAGVALTAIDMGRFLPF